METFFGLKAIYDSEFGREDSQIRAFLEREEYASRFRFLGPLFEAPRLLPLHLLPFPEFDTKDKSYEEIIGHLLGRKFHRRHLRLFGQKLALHGVHFINNIHAFNHYFEEDFSVEEYLRFPHELRVPVTEMKRLRGAKPLLQNYSCSKMLKLITTVFRASGKKQTQEIFRQMEAFQDVQFFIETEEYVDIEDGAPVKVSRGEEFYSFHYHCINWHLLEQDEIKRLAFFTKCLSESELRSISQMLPKKAKGFSEILRAARDRVSELRSLEPSKIPPKADSKSLNQEVIVLHGKPLLDFNIQVPFHVSDLEAAGIEMRNCLASYEDQILSGETQVLFLTQEGKRLFAIEITAGDEGPEFRQFLGVDNDDSLEGEEGEPYLEELRSLMRHHLLC